VIDFVNANLIPVWVDVRTTAWPQIPVVMKAWEPGPLSHKFLARTIVLSPDLGEFLNEDGARWVHDDPEGYLQMIQQACAKHRPVATRADRP
jgi:hypothetical protein